MGTKLIWEIKKTSKLFNIFSDIQVDNSLFLKKAAMKMKWLVIFKKNHSGYIVDLTAKDQLSELEGWMD